MRDGTCVKCGATDVMTASVATASALPVGGTRMSGVETNLYACMACGYQEHYATPTGLSHIRQHGTRVTPRR